MIITLIKNPEVIKDDKKSNFEMTYSGISQIRDNATLLLHFAGKRPLYYADAKGEYHVEDPDSWKIPMPSLILTGRAHYSYQSAQILNEVFKNAELEKIPVKSGKSVYHPEEFLKNNPGIDHLVIIGSEQNLTQWANLAGNSANRSEDSNLSIIYDGQPFYDSKRSEKLYMFDGIMDTVLLNEINSSKVKEMIPVQRILTVLKENSKQ